MSTTIKRYKIDSQRTVLLKRGTIFFRNSSIGCVVLNLSTGGAGLALESDDAIPLAFELEIESEPFRRHCILAWRLERRLGVTFEYDRMLRPERGPV